MTTCIDEKDITFVRINSVEDPLFHDACMLLKSSFVADERREFDGELLKRENFKLCAVFHADSFVGFKTWWSLDGFLFSEHIAIAEKWRNKGLGSTIFKKFFKLYPSELFVLESETPVTSIAARRIEMYRRIGFAINTYDYIQPAYAKDKAPVPMLLLSYPRAIAPAEYEEIARKIHGSVYDFVK